MAIKDILLEDYKDSIKNKDTNKKGSKSIVGVKENP